MKLIITITLLLLLPSCGHLQGKIDAYNRQQAAAKEQFLEKRRAEDAEIERTTVPLTIVQREDITLSALIQLRDPGSATIKFKGTSYVLNGQRMANFYLNARNGFGGFTGFNAWHALLDKDGNVTTTRRAGLNRVHMVW